MLPSFGSPTPFPLFGVSGGATREREGGFDGAIDECYGTFRDRPREQHSHARAASPAMGPLARRSPSERSQVCPAPRAILIARMELVISRMIPIEATPTI